jgi:hypothetical protein
MCRRQFLGSRSTIERNLYAIIENEDDIVYEQIKGGLFRILRPGNEKSVDEAEVLLAKKKESK